MSTQERAVKRAVLARARSRFNEVAHVLVRLNDVASGIVNADHGVI
jgi:hypothetical protein